MASFNGSIFFETPPKNLNQSDYKSFFENPIAQTYKQTGKPVNVRIQNSYAEDNLSNQSPGYICNSVNGEWYINNFRNEAGGLFK